MYPNGVGVGNSDCACHSGLSGVGLVMDTPTMPSTPGGSQTPWWQTAINEIGQIISHQTPTLPRIPSGVPTYPATPPFVNAGYESPYPSASAMNWTPWLILGGALLLMSSGKKRGR